MTHIQFESQNNMFIPLKKVCMLVSHPRYQIFKITAPPHPLKTVYPLRPPSHLQLVV